MEKIKWSEKLTIEKVLGRIGGKRTFLNNILRRKTNRIGYMPRKNCPFQDVIKGQMTEAKGVGGGRRRRRRRRRTQLLDDLRNRHWKLKEEAEVRKGLKSIVYQ